MDKLRCIPLVFISVVEECITHANFALLLLVNEVAKLLVPHPVLRVLSVGNGVVHELVDHVNVVDDVQDKSFEL